MSSSSHARCQLTPQLLSPSPLQPRCALACNLRSPLVCQPSRQCPTTKSHCQHVSKLSCYLPHMPPTSHQSLGTVHFEPPTTHQPGSLLALYLGAPLTSAQQVYTLLSPDQQCQPGPPTCMSPPPASSRLQHVPCPQKVAIRALLHCLVCYLPIAVPYHLTAHPFPQTRTSLLQLKPVPTSPCKPTPFPNIPTCFYCTSRTLRLLD